MNIATAGAYTSSLQNGSNNAMSPGLGGGTPTHHLSPPLHSRHSHPRSDIDNLHYRRRITHMQSRNREPSGGSTDSYRMDGLADDVVASRAVLYQTSFLGAGVIVEWAIAGAAAAA